MKISLQKLILIFLLYFNKVNYIVINLQQNHQKLVVLVVILINQIKVVVIWTNKICHSKIPMFLIQLH